MTQPLARPVSDNRLLRATGGPDLSVSLGTSLGAVFSTPMMTGLAASGAAQVRARNDAFTDDEFEAFEAERAERQREVLDLSATLPMLPDGRDRDAALSRLETLRAEGKAQIDTWTERAVEDGRLVRPEALAEEYGELGLTFSRPMSREEAKILADGKRAEIIRNALIERGPRGVLPGAAKFGAGLAAMATDPLEVASAFIPIVGQGGKAAAVARFGRVPGRIAVGAVEGGVGNLLTEPFYAALSRQQQLDYTMADSLLNVGLGVVFGGGIGTVAGVLSRSEARLPDVPAAKREVADVALRQFVNDQQINLTALLDGRDLRASTSLSRGPGDAPVFRPAAPALPAEAPRVTLLATAPDGQVRTFDTVQKADAFADRVQGETVRTEGGFAVRYPAKGDLERTPAGEPLIFPTERAAEKYLATRREKGDPAVIVPLTRSGERPAFAIARNMADVDIAALRAGRVADVPDGPNTRAVQTLPDGQARIDRAAREVVQARILARQAQDIAADPLADMSASRAADVRIPETFVEDSTEALDAMVRQLDLTDEERAFLAEVETMNAKASAYGETVEAYAACLGRSAA